MGAHAQENSMAKTNKIAISLPDEILQAVEKEREDSGESRSQFFRRAVEMLLRSKKEQARSQQYILAYKTMPETREEIMRAHQAASVILAEESWQ
jgi:metal-responsive CopG/Arc/MetJ family transcriptional regulator